MDIKNGAELALSQLSGPLTAMGFKVELAAFDDQADPNTGVANAKKIVSDPLGRRRSQVSSNGAGPLSEWVFQ